MEAATAEEQEAYKWANWKTDYVVKSINATTLDENEEIVNNDCKTGLDNDKWHTEANVIAEETGGYVGECPSGATYIKMAIAAALLTLMNLFWKYTYQARKYKASI